MKKFHKYIFFLILFFQYFVSNSQNTVYQIDITKEIGSTTWRYLRAGLHQAQEQNAKAVILRLNTYGGTVVHADSMRQRPYSMHPFPSMLSSTTMPHRQEHSSP